MSTLEALERIPQLKKKEQTIAQSLQSLAPQLETPFLHLLHQWESAFHKTISSANELIHSLNERNEDTRADHTAQKFLQSSRTQSEAFIQHLQLLQLQSSALINNNKAKSDIQGQVRQMHDDLNQLELTPHHEQPLGQQPATGEGNWSNPTSPMQTSPVPIGGHKLPPLPYPYNALEPYIDAKTMQLHHDKHHQGYVDGLNKAEKQMAEARRKNDFDLIKHWEREAAFHGAGHYLHTIFWNVMSPQGGGTPTGALATQIKQDFGSFDAFKKHFSKAAEQVEAVGWAILVWSPRSHRLEILQAEKHQNLSQWDVVPLLVLDVWEHAYYLKYNNKRADYVDAWWNVVNWPYVAERFQQARQLQWVPY
jgi:Fe-Mn family superoxide dismutase